MDIKDSVYSSFKNAINSLQLGGYYDAQQHLFKRTDVDARIRFRGLDDEENIKGIEDFNIVYNNEWSQFLERHFEQQRKRLRGKPNQKFICDWNPVSSKLWLYENWIDRDEWTDLPLAVEGKKYSQLDPEYSFKRINKSGDTVWMKVTYRDNYWIVGHPAGKGGFLDEHTISDFEKDRIYKPNLYRIYANGERGIMRTGGEFWKQFDETKHVGTFAVSENEPINIVVDSNNSPYVAVSCWQVSAKHKQIKQVHEIPCKAPDNNAIKAARLVAKWIKSTGNVNYVNVYGDPASNARSTVDENNKSFFRKFFETLVSEGIRCIDKIEKSSPRVALSASFVNDIYEGLLGDWSILINSTCKVSIDDYCTVKEDVDGTMKKAKERDKETQITFEPYGHFSDNKRYIITSILKDEFKNYGNKNKLYMLSVD